jgi:hypothetical protein
MTQVFLYGEVDLPAIPDHLLQTADQAPVEKYVTDIGYGKIFEKNGRTLTNCSYAKWTVTHQALIDWIKNTVPAWPESEAVTIQKNIPVGTDTNTTFPVHHDVRRMFALNYIIRTGGDNVITSWFRDTNQPLVRSLNKKPGVQSDSGPVNYADCECLASVQCEPSKWYLISTVVLHDVDHVDSERSAVTIPYFSDNVVQEFKIKKLFKTIKEIPNVT